MPEAGQISVSLLSLEATALQAVHPNTLPANVLSKKEDKQTEQCSRGASDGDAFGAYHYLKNFAIGKPSMLRESYKANLLPIS
jgi:hypothetical protein